MKTGTWMTIVRAASGEGRSYGSRGHTVREIAEEADLSPSTVRRYLPEMVRRGVLRTTGGGCTAAYRATPAAAEAAATMDFKKIGPALG
jgi:DNA-binding IclR family transcriptional regulator